MMMMTTTMMTTMMIMINYHGCDYDDYGDNEDDGFDRYEDIDNAIQ